MKPTRTHLFYLLLLFLSIFLVNARMEKRTGGILQFLGSIMTDVSGWIFGKVDVAKKKDSSQLPHSNMNGPVVMDQMPYPFQTGRVPRSIDEIVQGGGLVGGVVCFSTFVGDVLRDEGSLGGTGTGTGVGTRAGLGLGTNGMGEGLGGGGGNPFLPSNIGSSSNLADGSLPGSNPFGNPNSYNFMNNVGGGNNQPNNQAYFPRNLVSNSPTFGSSSPTTNFQKRQLGTTTTTTSSSSSSPLRKVRICLTGDRDIAPIQVDPTTAGLRVTDPNHLLKALENTITITNLPNWSQPWNPFLPTKDMWDAMQRLQKAQEQAIENLLFLPGNNPQNPT